MGEWMSAHLDREEEGEEECPSHLEEIGPCSHTPEEDDFVWRFSEDWIDQLAPF
jgi:hypothetical protein